MTQTYGVGFCVLDHPEPCPYLHTTCCTNLDGSIIRLRVVLHYNFGHDLNINQRLEENTLDDCPYLTTMFSLYREFERRNFSLEDREVANVY